MKKGGSRPQSDFAKNYKEARPKMILTISEPASMAEYQDLMQSVGRVDVPRPSKCPKDSCAGHMWKHTCYFREAKDSSGRGQEICIPRFRCSKCPQVVSCLFGFLVPYVQYAVEAISDWIALYIETPCTYDELEWGEEKDVRSTAYRKIDQFSKRAGELCEQVQTEAMLSEPENMDMAELIAECPNAWKAKSLDKSERLNNGASLMCQCRTVARSAIHEGSELLSTMYKYFVSTAEEFRSIYCWRKKIELSNQQTVKCAIF